MQSASDALFFFVVRLQCYFQLEMTYLFIFKILFFSTLQKCKLDFANRKCCDAIIYPCPYYEKNRTKNLQVRNCSYIFVLRKVSYYVSIRNFHWQYEYRVQMIKALGIRKNEPRRSDITIRI